MLSGLIHRSLSLLFVLCGVMSLGAQPLKIVLTDSVKGNFHVEVFQTDMGGGGYITGIVQDKNNPNILYARSDVAGVFKSIDGGKSWSMHNGGLDKMSDHYCHSLALDPFDNQSLLRASGDVRNFRFVGRIHRSTDGARTWHPVLEGVDYYGNGPTRQFGELICYNPAKQGEVAAGSYSKGLWVSGDGGATWKCRGLKGDRIACVRYFDNRIYVGTISDAAMFKGNLNDDAIKSKLAELQDFPRGKKSCLYMSDDGGHHWQTLFTSDTLPIYELIIADGGKTVMFASNPGVYRSTDGGHKFSLVEALPHELRYRTLVQSDEHPNRCYAAEEFPTRYPVTLYYSDDCGKSWQPLSPDCGPENMFEFPEEWHGRRPDKIGSAVSHILVDCADPNKLYISNWWGVTITYDHGKNFYGHQFKGIGIICCETLVKHPTRQGVWACGVCDHAPALSFDDSQSYRMAPVTAGPGRTVCSSRSDSSLMLFAAQRKGQYMRLYKSSDLGRTGRIVWELKGDNFIQDIKEDPFVAGRFWAYLEGSIVNPSDGEAQAGLYRSDDFGETWTRIGFPTQASTSTLPADPFRIDRDLTPIVNYQHKNGCGTGQMLTLDAQREGTIYVGEWTTGLYRSDDFGKTWTNIGRNLPFDAKRYRVLSLVYADPDRCGTLYAGFWNGGLYRSDNFGETWRPIRPAGLKRYNANSFAISRDAEGRTLMALGTSNHPLGDTPTHLFVCTDDAASAWTDIYDSALGCQRWISVAADAKTMRVHTATAGDGIFYFDLRLF